MLLFEALPWVPPDRTFFPELEEQYAMREAVIAEARQTGSSRFSSLPEEFIEELRVKAAEANTVSPCGMPNTSVFQCFFWTTAVRLVASLQFRRQ